jgi:hypothetical protein
MHPRRDEVEHNGAVIVAFLLAFVSVLPAASVLTFIYVSALCACAHRGVLLVKEHRPVLLLTKKMKKQRKK